MTSTPTFALSDTQSPGATERIVLGSGRVADTAAGHARAMTPVRGCGSEWLSLLSISEKLVLAGIRRRIGPEGDLKAAYRRWYNELMDEHDQLVSTSYDRLEAAFAEPDDAS